MFGLKVFSTVTQFPQGRVEWCAAFFVIPFICLMCWRYFFNSLPNSTYKAEIGDAALLWFLSLCLVLEYFQQSYPIPPMKQGLSDVLLFCSFLCLVLVFFNSPTQFHL
jgi:hypothetical protein